MTAQQPDFSDLNKLAIEACDLWQEHLSSFAKDPAARAELTRFLEPQRRMFADWVQMMRQAPASAPADRRPSAGETPHERPRPAPEPASSQPAADSVRNDARSDANLPPSRGVEHGDDALRVAQLAYRVAELERRLAQLESKSAGNAGHPRRAQRASS